METSNFQITAANIQRIINSNSDGVVILDKAYIAEFVNPAAELLLGKPANEILGSDLGLSLRTDGSTEINLANRGGEPLTIDVRVIAIDWDESAAYLATLRDITDRKKMEEELRSTYQQVLEQQKSLIEEERLKVILQMAGATVHELSQPLTVLLGNLDMLDPNEKETEEFELSVREIKKAGESIADIVRKIQSVRHYETKPYYEHISIVNIDQETKILVIEDSDADYVKLSCILENTGKIRLARAKKLKDAYRLLADGSYDLIILDYLLPDGTGLDFLKSMDEKEIHIPIVVITGQGDEVIASQFVKAGVYDYLPKANVSNQSVARVLSNALEKFQLKKEMQRTIQKMSEMATRDELTDLYNRRYFIDVMEREISSAQRYGKDVSLCMINLDEFKKINESYGKAAGDMILKEFSKIMKESIRKSDLPCRYGGDEFAVILTHTDMKKAQIFGDRIRKTIEAHPFDYNGLALNITISVGVSACNKTADQTPETLLADADRAMAEAKGAGGNKVAVFF